MLVIPALDLKDGCCVRLFQGRREEETIFSRNPLEMAKKWEVLKAKLLHVVDLDGAVFGKPMNKEIIINLLRSVSIPLQIGGGIRDIKTIEGYLLEGAERIILGSIAHQKPELFEEASRLFPGKIAVAIDARGEYVAIKGWTEVTRHKRIELAKRFEDLGVSLIIYTDITRDGTMKGVNFRAAEEMVKAVNIPLIVAGGISTLSDIAHLAKIERYGLEGVIIGKALYLGSLDFVEASRVAQRLHAG